MAAVAAAERDPLDDVADRVGSLDSVDKIGSLDESAFSAAGVSALWPSRPTQACQTWQTEIRPRGRGAVYRSLQIFTIFTDL